MAAAYHRFYNGAVVAITKTGQTHPDIRKNTPHGNPGAEGGVTNKTPGSGSKVNNGTSSTSPNL